MIEALRAASGRDVSRETMASLERYVELLVDENSRQNLIAKSTEEDVWSRHIVDGAQLVAFAEPATSWCDIGSGPGLPGLVISILTGDPMTLIEPRRRRVEFLELCREKLGLPQLAIFQGKAEAASEQFGVITGRAVAPLSEFFGLASHLAHSGTKWVLPKGQRAKSELDEAKSSWQGRFKLVPSLTNPEASIVVGEGVQPRGKR